MTIRRIGWFVCLPVLLILAGDAAGQEKKNFSLDACIIGAVENNLSLAAEVLNPEMADISVLRANEKFLPSLSFSYSDQETNTASYSFIDSADQVQAAYRDYWISLNQAVPTGGNISIKLDTYRNETNRSFQTINPRYGSTLTFNFTQPLLRDFGFSISRREIIFARNNRDISENQLKTALLDTIYKVEESYWNLVYSIENLQVKQQSLQLARDLLEESQRKIDVGTMAPIEIFTAQAEVATREADILQARALVKNNEDRLKTIINLAATEEDDSIEIVPTDRPDFVPKDITLDEAVAVALQNRPDLEALRIDLKNKQLNVKYTRNQMLPGLNVFVNYWSPGISGDRILYLNNNALSGVVIGTVPGAPADALKDAFNFKYQNWTIGLTLDLPLSTLITRADFARARVSLDQAMINLQDQRQQIILEIKTALRAVNTNRLRVQAYKAARELAEKKLSAEQEKFKVGKSTDYQLLQYQRDVGDARTTELRSMVDFILSSGYLDKVLGTTFVTKNIRLSGIGF